MSILKDKIGLVLKPYSLEVEKGKIKEFAIAIGDDNPIYYSLEAAMAAGYEGIPIPLTFLQVIDSFGGYGSDELMEKLNLNRVKILHGEQEYEYFMDVYAGDTLSVVSKVTNVETKLGKSGGMDLVTTENEYRNQEGDLVAISRRVLVHRH